MKAFQHKLSDPLPELHDQHIFEAQEEQRARWDAEREAQEHENDLRWESLMADESTYGPINNQQGNNQ